MAEVAQCMGDEAYLSGIELAQTTSILQSHYIKMMVSQCISHGGQINGSKDEEAINQNQIATDL
jgi:hypothetical protein